MLRTVRAEVSKQGPAVVFAPFDKLRTGFDTSGRTVSRQLNAIWYEKREFPWIFRSSPYKY
jgi:hypothetical protein